MVEERKRPSQRVIPPLLTAGGRDISGQGNGTHFFFPGKKRRRGIKEGPVDFFLSKSPLPDTEADGGWSLSAEKEGGWRIWTEDQEGVERGI